MLDTGCHWRDLPEQLGCSSGHTAWRRSREWQDAGVRCRRYLARRRIKFRIAPRGIEGKYRLGRVRWVVERTSSQRSSSATRPDASIHSLGIHR